MVVSLTWVRDNYDINRNRYIDQSEATTAEDDFYHESKISEEQLGVVYDAYENHTLLPAYATPAAAEGSIVNFNYPSSAERGERVAIRAAIKNVGDETGTFKLQLYRGSSRVAQSAQFTVAANRTSSSKTLYTTTPGSGTSQSYQLKCVRLT